MIVFWSLTLVDHLVSAICAFNFITAMCLFASIIGADPTDAVARVVVADCALSCVRIHWSCDIHYVVHGIIILSLVYRLGPPGLIPTGLA